jgi:hypothetical protein
MKTEIRTLIIVFVLIALSVPAFAGDRDLQRALATGEVETVRINLNPWGPHLGFETEIEGNDPAMAALLSVISSAEPSQGHKCANRGAIRIRLNQFRLYDGDSLEGVFSVQRAVLVDALEGLGVPIDDPAFGDG